MVDVLGLFRQVERDAFRLETLQTYDVVFEAERLEAFRKGEPLPETESMVRDHRMKEELRRTGRRIWKVHIVDLPLSDYLRYEFVAYEGSIAAGEEVFIADRSSSPDLADLRDDFVLFDDAAVLWYRYTDEGKLTGYEYDDDPASLERCRAARDLAVRYAVPFHDFVAAHLTG